MHASIQNATFAEWACKRGEFFWRPHREFGRERVLTRLVEDNPVPLSAKSSCPLRLPYFVAVRPKYFETHKPIAMQATDQYRVFIPTVKAKNDYYGLAQREELL
jgi:hypothetical protein